MKPNTMTFLSIFILIICLLSFSTETQELQHETATINIEVPVRVFKGDTFIDDLTIDDFEIYEDGVLQKVEAVYLIKKTAIEREESKIPNEKVKQKYFPDLNRHFVLLFEVYDYLPKIADSIDYFFNNIIMPNDTLAVVTPLKTYHIKKDSFEKLPKNEIASQLKSKLRKDTLLGNAQYKSLIRDIENNVNNILLLKGLLMRFEQLYYISEKRLLEFAEYLKNREGQNIVFLFYQREMLPQISHWSLIRRMNPANTSEFLDLIEVSDLYKRDITFDVNKIKQVFSDSSILIHFLYLTKSEIHGLNVERMQAISSLGVEYVEHSEDIFSAFNEVAKATGGLSTSSFNAASAFQQAVSVSENYYLLYYTPKNYKADGKFKKIKVKVMGKNYKVMHRAGYIAD